MPSCECHATHRQISPPQHTATHGHKTYSRSSCCHFLPLSTCLIVFLLLCFSCVTLSAGNYHYLSALTFQVEPRSEECFYESLSSGSSFSLEFEVVRGGLLDIRLRVQDPSRNTIIEKMAFFNRKDDVLNEADGKVTFVASSTGTYSICFDNTMSRWTPKVVSFFIVHNPDTQGEAQRRQQLDDEQAKLQDLGPMVDSIIKIADALDVIEQQQHHERVREQNHRDVTEQTNSRLQWYSFIESLLLIGLTAAQLQYIRNWFKDTGKVGRV